MITTQREQLEPSDAAFAAYHEAGHCVLMYRLGFGVKHTSILPGIGKGGTTEAARRWEEFTVGEVGGREHLERMVMVLHAGCVAERLFRPTQRTTISGNEHRGIHGMLGDAEDDPAVLTTWCDYLWQRTYDFLRTPLQWLTVHTIAAELETRKALDGREVMELVRSTDKSLEPEPAERASRSTACEGGT
jgi:hypothetical protein